MPWSKPSPGASFKMERRQSKRTSYRFYSAVNLWWLASNMTWPTTVIFPNSGGPFQMGISMSTWRMMFQSLSDQQMQRWKVERINMLKTFEDHLLSTCARFHRRNKTKTTCWKHRNSTINLNPIKFITYFHWFSSWIVVSKAINHHQLPTRHVWGSPAAHVGCHSPQHFRQLFPGHRPGTKKCEVPGSPFLVANICLYGISYFVWNRDHRILFDMNTAD